MSLDGILQDDCSDEGWENILAREEFTILFERRRRSSLVVQSSGFRLGMHM